MLVANLAGFWRGVFRLRQGQFENRSSGTRLRKTFDPLNRQSHIAAVLFPAAGENLRRLFGIFRHRSTCG